MVDKREDGGGNGEAVKTAPQLSPKLRKQIGVVVEDSSGKKTEAKKSQGPRSAKDDTEKSRSDDELMRRSVDLDDARTDEAVNDIVSYEGDVMLAVSDATADERTRKAEEATGKSKKSGGWLSAIFWTFVIFIVIVAVALAVLFASGGKVTGLKL